MFNLDTILFEWYIYFRKKVITLNRFIKQYDIVEVDLGSKQVGSEKFGKRPCVVLSNNTHNANSDNVIVAPVTKLKNKLEKGNYVAGKTHIILSKKFYHNLRYTSIIQLEDLRSVSKERLETYIGDLTQKSIGEIKKGIECLFFL